MRLNRIHRTTALLILWAIATVAQTAPRVISADGAITETIVALGASEQLVGVDTTSHHPPDVVDDLPRVGYLRALPLEGILSLEPTHLITTEEAGPEKTLERVEKAGVDVTQLPVARTPKQTIRRIRRVGALVDRSDQAATLAQRLSEDIQRIRNQMASKQSARVLVLLAAGNHGVMLAGKNTAANALLESLGLTNALDHVSGYKPASRESFLAAAPDAVIIAEASPGQFKPKEWPALTRLPAWQSGQHLTENAMFLLGFGPRLADAMAALASVVPEREATAHAH
ncbi:iron complex transport system substrate-binding protein [Tamilnaduibacter salinus]|uniref:Iron complex transport system substrate-binding protein n=1 Tax=Tamilnaduibacter salinus TaxID=1484056 RepID=A0A2U1CZ99_9GAMM|nr:helical backbone metal receptor [Tamilnaduibacter salinus]PVY78120.1 iron complex transport system substrate-binding protein [Tamilnaduibacter salinus]